MNKRAILSCIYYFDIFKYPLKVNEIVKYLNTQSPIENQSQFVAILDDLVNENQIFHSKGFYSRDQNIEELISNRIEYERRADETVAEALKYGNLIRKFPFIKGVLISGSLSKHVMKEGDDIDFFIISKANRIWASKIFLKLYKVFFLGNSYESFCLNYFISDGNLKIHEKNTYTATELATLIPIGCDDLHLELLNSNYWHKEFLPNFNYKKNNKYTTGDIDIPTSTKFVEKVLSGKIGHYLDNAVMKLHRYWNKRKYAHLSDEKDFELMMRASKEQIKVHPPNGQGKILKSYNKQVAKINNAGF